MKPQLAEDAILDKLILPCWEQPKIDGVRALNQEGILTGRSLDPFEGYGLTDYFSKFKDFDGEMTLGDNPMCTDRLCNKTSGAMGRFKGVTEMADFHWWLFDYLTEETSKMTYRNRYWELLRNLPKDPRIHVVESSVCNTMDDVYAAIARNAEAGYEGTILRNPDALPKPGRSTLKGQQLWRVKPWADSEMRVTGFTEGNSNSNVATKNSLGRTERSSAKAGLIPNGMVGSIQGVLLADYVDMFTGRTLFPKGLEITIQTGTMTETEMVMCFKQPVLLVGHIIKFKHMTHGTKDLPRFGSYLSHRLKQDIS